MSDDTLVNVGALKGALTAVGKDIGVSQRTITKALVNHVDDRVTPLESKITAIQNAIVAVGPDSSLELEEGIVTVTQNDGEIIGSASV